MSLILDALNKSEGERPTPADVPGLQAQHGPAESQSPAAWRRWLVPGLILLLLIALVASWLRDPATQVEPALESVTYEVSESGTVTEVAVEPSSQLQMQGQQESRGPNQQEIMAQRLAMRDLAVQAAARQAAARQSPRALPPAGNSMQADVAALYAKPPQGSKLPSAVSMESVAPAYTAATTPPAAVSQETESALDIEALALAAEQALGERPVVEHAVPTIDQLSQRTKDEIPTIFFSGHSWSSNPQERSVVLNGESHREGDTIKPGLQLVEILKDSIVMDYRGTEFRLRSLNSWVNL
jgi:hypothetical protein